MFDTLQVPYDQLLPTNPFSGVNDGSTIPLEQVCLPVTFSKHDNYHTKLVDFDVAHIRLPYNAILWYPALAKFMAVAHHGYNVLKLPGSGGIITVPYEERDAVCSLERAFQAAAIDDPDNRSEGPPEAIPKKKQLRRARPQEDGVVRQADVRDVEVDELGAVVLALSEGEG